MVSAGKIAAGMFALFFLSTLYIFFDPVIEDNIYASMGDQLSGDTRPQELLDLYLETWQIWPAMFILAILLYTLTSGRTKDHPSTINQY